MSLEYFINFHFETNRQPTFEEYKKEVVKPKSKYKTKEELKASYEKMLAKSISKIEGYKPAQTLTQPQLDEKQKKVFEELVEGIMAKADANHKNPFSLRGLKVKEKSGGSFTGKNIVDEARRRILDKNKQRILSSFSVESITENVNSIIDNPDLDEETKRVAIEDLMEQVKIDIQKMKEEVEKGLTKEEQADLEKSDLGTKFSMAGAIDAVIMAMTLQKGDPDIIKEISNKLATVYNDPKFKAAVVNTAALAAAYASIPEGSGENVNTVVSAITSPTFLKALKDFGGGAYGSPKQYAGSVVLAGILYSIYKYSGSIYKVLADGLVKPISMLSYLLGTNASETKKFVEKAYANIQNTTVEKLNETIYGKFLEQTLAAIPDEKIDADKSHEDVKLLVNAFDKLPTNTLLGIESGKINQDNFLNSLNDTKGRQEMITIINAFSNPAMTGITSINADTTPTGLSETIPESGLVVLPPQPQPQPQAPQQLLDINKLNKPVIPLLPLPAPSNLNNNYTQNTLPNIMSFQTPYKTYEDLPEYLRVLITREEFNAAMMNEGSINKLITKNRSFNGLLSTRLAKGLKLPEKTGGGYLRAFPINVPNANVSVIKPDEQYMIGSNTKMASGAKKLTQIEFGKVNNDNQQLIGTETRLIKKVKKIPLY